VRRRRGRRKRVLRRFPEVACVVIQKSQLIRYLAVCLGELLRGIAAVLILAHSILLMKFNNKRNVMFYVYKNSNSDLVMMTLSALPRSALHFSILSPLNDGLWQYVSLSMKLFLWNGLFQATAQSLH
jgi:hypothetical protein